MNALVAGWFSFEGMGATAGDLLARDLVVDWLKSAGVPHDVATAPPFEGGVDWGAVDPHSYSDVVFVCGPFGNGPPLTEFLPRFDHARMIGLDLSMLQPLEVWNPFDLLWERDSSRASRPDLSLAAPARPVPVVGVVLVHEQSEYGDRGRHGGVHDAVERLLGARECARVRIDTRLDDNATGLRTPHEVESLVARMDTVVTTRLHGLVLALKNGVPAVAIDPIAGGAKILRQAETLDWPLVLTPETLDDTVLEEAFEASLTERSRTRARQCRDRAIEAIHDVRESFLSHFCGRPT